MTLRIEVYDDSQKSVWDEFVSSSKNGTFLFFRDYMDYHRDRFEDHSLLVCDDKDRVVALLPANKKEDTLVSHGGLTYGGFVTDEGIKASLMLEVLEHALVHLRQQGLVKLIYKPMPHIYHRLPAEEDSYALFRCKAVLYRRDLTTTVVPELEIKFQERRLRSIKKALRAGVTWRPSEDYAQFWQVLEYNLWSVHRLKPVHTLAEIRRLQASFPENIKLFCSFLGGEIVAGTVIYETHTVAHAQYTASSERGRSCGALDLLFLHLITEQYKHKKYFDLGVSTEAQGRYLNQGLAAYKEGFGGRAIVYDYYEIDLK